MPVLFLLGAGVAGQPYSNFLASTVSSILWSSFGGTYIEIDGSWMVLNNQGIAQLRN